MSGWIALHRGWRDCPAFEDRRDPMADADAWLWIIEHTAWKAHRRRAGQGQSITIERGQIHVSDRALATAFHWDKKRVRRFLARLEEHKMVVQNRDQSGTTLTICNYDKYQSVSENVGPAKDQSGTTQEQRKQGKQENHHQAAFGKSDPGEPDFDLAQLMSRCCDAAGMPTPDPMRDFAKHSKALAAVRGWKDAGIGEAAMLAKIGEVRRRAPSQIQSLGYFDGAVREVAKAAMPAQHSDALAMAQRILAEKRRAA